MELIHSNTNDRVIGGIWKGCMKDTKLNPQISRLIRGRRKKGRKELQWRASSTRVGGSIDQQMILHSFDEPTDPTFESESVYIAETTSLMLLDNCVSKQEPAGEIETGGYPFQDLGYTISRL